MKCAPSQYRAAPPALAVKPRLIRQMFLPPLLIALMLGLGCLGFWISDRSGIRTLSDTGQRQLELQARAVESEIDRYTYLPSLLELENTVAALLAQPDAEHRQPVNDYLEGLNRRSKSRAIYVLDTSGRVQASSNWRDSDSYVGEDLAFRPYFQDAVRGLPGRFYGIGSTAGEPGYYLAHGLEQRGRIIGVAVIKVQLQALEALWQRARLETFVSDENGIIILSSDPAWRLKSLRPLTPENKERLARSLQYYWTPFSELQPLARDTVAEGVEKLTFPASSASHTRASYLAQSQPLNESRWQFTLLTPLQDQRREAIIHGVLVAVAFALCTILLIAWNERRKVIATRLAAREALEEANNLLERRITERTSDLRASNDRLKGQIRERRQAEDTLRKAQDELVQAGKLAAIGQMSTSIAHELNQPLAALRTLSGNTVRFLERGALDTASTNLRTMNDLIDRMGRITASLRAFARRGDDQGRASMTGAVDAALQLLEARLQGVQVFQQIEPAQLPIDQTRLEQILVNLIGNALDAMHAQAQPQLSLTSEVNPADAPGKYRLRVGDNGHGITADAREHLFEPFFTTKPGDHGLGLGLTLSASLAAAAAGHLGMESSGPEGTVFILSLPLPLLPSPSASASPRP